MEIYIYMYSILMDKCILYILSRRLWATSYNQYFLWRLRFNFYDRIFFYVYMYIFGSIVVVVVAYIYIYILDVERRPEFFLARLFAISSSLCIPYIYTFPSSSLFSFFSNTPITTTTITTTYNYIHHHFSCDAHSSVLLRPHNFFHPLFFYFYSFFFCWNFSSDNSRTKCSWIFFFFPSGCYTLYINIIYNNAYVYI